MKNITIFWSSVISTLLTILAIYVGFSSKPTETEVHDPPMGGLDPTGPLFSIFLYFIGFASSLLILIVALKKKKNIMNKSEDTETIDRDLQAAIYMSIAVVVSPVLFCFWL